MARNPGRTVTYPDGRVKNHMITLVRRYNISQALEILRAAPGTRLASKRNLTLIPSPLKISYPTLLKFARAAGVQKTKGCPVGTKRKKKKHKVV